MEEIKKIKSAGAVSGTPHEEEMELISSFARKSLTPEEVYTFSVILCDNEIDRDFERFSVEALYALKEMFQGVTGIFDHSMKSSDQAARIYKTEIVTDPSKRTAADEDYVCLKAACYMLRTEGCRELIAQIDGGIKKEVSVSCAVGSYTCSVCGCDMRSSDCSHSLGSMVDGKLCHAVLGQPTDAYEWSFVAVPAQRNAGVSKAMRGAKSQIKPPQTADFSKGFSAVFSEAREDITVTKSQAAALSEYLEAIKAKAEFGEKYRAQAEKDIISLSAFTLPHSDTEVLSQILKKLNLDEVEMLRKSFALRGEQISAGEVQLKKGDSAREDNSQFKI